MKEKRSSGRVAQLEEPTPYTRVVAGPNPAATNCRCSSGVEQWSCKPLAGGSNPSSGSFNLVQILLA